MGENVDAHLLEQLKKLQAKYNVMNEVKCRAKVEPGLLTKVLRAFSRDFKGLKPPRADAKD